MKRIVLTLIILIAGLLAVASSLPPEEWQVRTCKPVIEDRGNFCFYSLPTNKKAAEALAAEYNKKNDGTTSNIVRVESE